MKGSSECEFNILYHRSSRIAMQINRLFEGGRGVLFRKWKNLLKKNKS
jgi:hypothetical protein